MMKKIAIFLVYILILFANSALARDRKEILKVSKARVVLRVPAWSEILVKNQVVVLEKDFLHIAAYNVKTGKLQWRIKFQDESYGTHDLHAMGGHVLVWAGNHIHVISPQSGKIIASYSAPWNGSRPPCYLDCLDGLCSFRCQCQLYLFNCTSGKQVGKRYHKSYVEFFDFGADGAPSGGCYGPGGWVIGRTRDTALLFVEDEKSKPSGARLGRPLTVIGLNIRTGEERWHLTGLERDYSWSSKISEDKITFFLTNGDGKLMVFDSSTGKKLLERKRSKAPQKARKEDEARDDERQSDDYYEFVGWLDHPKALFVFMDGTAELLDGENFKTRWRKTGFKKGQIGIPTGVEINNYELQLLYESKVIKLMDPATGKQLSSFKLPKYGRLVSDGRGSYLAIGKSLRRYDSKGRLVAQAKIPARYTTSEIRDRFVVLSGQDAGTILYAESLEEAVDIEGRFTVSDMDSSSHGDTLLLHGFFTSNRHKLSESMQVMGEAVLIKIEDRGRP